MALRFCVGTKPVMASVTDRTPAHIAALPNKNSVIPLRYRHKLAAGSLLLTLLATLVPPITAAAQEPETSAGKSADNDGSPPSWSLPEPRLTESTSRWTVSVEAIVLGHSGGPNQMLVERLPGGVTFYDTAVAPGAAAFNSNQFPQGFSAGPDISLTYHGDSGYGAELSYFNVFDQSATKAIGPDSPADWSKTLKYDNSAP